MNYDKLILDIDHNVKPAILTLGSILLSCSNKNGFIDLRKYKNIASKYMLYNDKSVCDTYRWLEENNLIEWIEPMRTFKLKE